MKDSGDTIRFAPSQGPSEVATLFYDPEHPLSLQHAKFDARVDNNNNASFYCEECDLPVRIVKLLLYRDVSFKDGLLPKLTTDLVAELRCGKCGSKDSKRIEVGRVPTHEWK